MLAIWNEFVRFVSDSAPAFAVGLMLSAGVQWLVARSHWAARALSWVAQSVPGAALAGAALPGCSMTTVPLAIPLKRQGADDGPLLALIITSALLGPASIMLTFTMFCPVWGALRVALPLIAVCGFGWGLQRFEKSGTRTSTKRPVLWRAGAATAIPAVLPGKTVPSRRGLLRGSRFRCHRTRLMPFSGRLPPPRQCARIRRILHRYARHQSPRSAGTKRPGRPVCPCRNG